MAGTLVRCLRCGATVELDHRGPCPECDHNLGEYVPKLTEKQTVKELRGIARSKAVMPSESNALRRAADIIEKQREHIKALQRHRLVPVDMQPRRGTVEPDNQEVIILNFKTHILDSTEKREVDLYFEPLGFGLFVMALLHAMGFPEGDLEYVRERLEKELRPDEPS